MIKNKICHNCSSADSVVPIVYGYPHGETMKKYNEGKLILGGCMQEIGAPKWYCKKCGDPPKSGVLFTMLNNKI